MARSCGWLAVASCSTSNSLIDLVGNTPLLRLSRVTDGAKPLVLAKIEYLNPGGSVKDRIAVKMVEAAEREGKLKPGGTIVEPTSGNTGVGLAIVAQARGYPASSSAPTRSARTSATCWPRTGPGSWSARPRSSRSTRTPTTRSRTG